MCNYVCIGVYVRVWQGHGGSGGAALELLGDAGEVLALVKGVLQLQLRRPPRPVPGERARAVRTAAVHALHVKYFGAERVPHRHEHHPVVRQLRHRRQPADKGKNITHCCCDRSVGASNGGAPCMRRREVRWGQRRRLTVWSPGRRPGCQC